MSLICIITALPAESRIFLDGLKLRQARTRGIRLYEGGDYLLLQTGLGKLNAAAGTGALLQARPDVSAIINAGVAGSDADIGTVHLAHEVRDTATGMHWYPHLPPQRIVERLPTACVHTSDTASHAYSEGVLFDMEAAGIFLAASAYLSTDAMHCIKVVSDNSSQSLAALAPAVATELMHAVLPVVQRISDWHRQSQQQVPWSAALDSCCTLIQRQVHHSASDLQQLQRLLQRYLALTGHVPELQPLLQLKSAKAIRQHLQNGLQLTPLRYDI